MGYLRRLGGDIRPLGRGLAPLGAPPHDARGQVHTGEIRFRASGGMVRARDECQFCDVGIDVLSYGFSVLCARLCVNL